MGSKYMGMEEVVDGVLTDWSMKREEGEWIWDLGLVGLFGGEKWHLLNLCWSVLEMMDGFVSPFGPRVSGESEGREGGSWL